LITTFARAAAVLTLLICALVGGVRLLPYDRSHEEALRAFLFPEGCAPPCVMGITPGVTTEDEVQTIVDNFDKAGLIDHDNYSSRVVNAGDYSLIMWIWNPSPIFPYADATQNYSNVVTFVNKSVESIYINSGLTYSEVQLMFGRSSDILFDEEDQAVIYQYDGFRATYNLHQLYCFDSQYRLLKLESNFSFAQSFERSEEGTRSVSLGYLIHWQKNVPRILKPYVCP
jgi:hypothetical protein